MMKKLLTTLALTSLLALGLTSCGDDGSTEPQFGPGQNPLQGFINRLSLVAADDNEPIGTYGTILEFQKEGRIAQMCLMVPIDEIFALTLWDLTDTTMIINEYVEADSGVLICIDISDVPVSAGDRLAVTMTGPGLFIWNSDGIANSGNPIFPSSIFDITLVNWGFSDNPEGINFPTDFDNRFYAGLADVVFEAKLE